MRRRHRWFTAFVLAATVAAAAVTAATGASDAGGSGGRPSDDPTGSGSSAAGFGVDRGAGVRRCRDVWVRGLEAGGGCDLVVSEAPATLTALTLFGDRRLGRCRMTFRMFVGGSGALAITEVGVLPAPGAAGAICGDVLPCRRDLEEIDEIEKLPWRGEVAVGAAGQAQAAIDLCFDTCLGRFEGRTVFELEQTAKGLRIVAKRAALGTSGLELSGRWSAKPYAGGALRLVGR